LLLYELSRVFWLRDVWRTGKGLVDVYEGENAGWETNGRRERRGTGVGGAPAVGGERAARQQFRHQLFAPSRPCGGGAGLEPRAAAHFGFDRPVTLGAHDHDQLVSVGVSLVSHSGCHYEHCESQFPHLLFSYLPTKSCPGVLRTRTSPRLIVGLPRYQPGPTFGHGRNAPKLTQSSRPCRASD